MKNYSAPTFDGDALEKQGLTGSMTYPTRRHCCRVHALLADLRKPLLRRLRTYSSGFRNLYIEHVKSVPWPCDAGFQSIL